MRHHDNDTIIIVLYVDDLLIAGNNRHVLNHVKSEFSSRYKMKDIGAAHEFLGIHILRNRANGTLQINQVKYIEKILTRFSMTESKNAPTPMPTAALTEQNGGIPRVSTATPYREAIGSLMYLMICTRPDIAYAVGRLAQHAERPSIEHWKLAKRVIQYVKGTQYLSLTYHRQKEMRAVGYCDSDWGGCLETRKSTEGYVFFLGGGAVSWRSKKQPVIATSSCEAEYISAFSAAKEAIWLSNLIAIFLHHREIDPITIRLDNQGAIAMAKRTTVNSRTKHIDIRYHFLQDVVQREQITLLYIPSEEQTADALTKPLSRNALTKHRESMGLKTPIDY